MFERLEETEKRYREIEEEMAKPDAVSNMETFKLLARERTELKEVVDLYRDWKRQKEEAVKVAEMIQSETEEELKELAREEAAVLEKAAEKLEARLTEKLLKKHETTAKSTFLEIRAGTGGGEAALFARDLLTMYLKYAEKNRWKTELMEASTSDLGGLKEAILVIENKDAFNMLRYESGVHRVQRVPLTEAQGRIHTSTVTVAVLAEPEELELNISPEEVRVDVFRSSGPGRPACEHHRFCREDHPPAHRPCGHMPG